MFLLCGCNPEAFKEEYVTNTVFVTFKHVVQYTDENF